MFARNLLSDSVPVLKTSILVADALSLMEEFKVSHLPIVNNEEFLGLLSEADLLNHEHFEDPVGNVKLSLQNAYCVEDQHVFDLLKILHEQSLTILPVLNSRNIYKGSILLRDLLRETASLFSVNNPGGVIILEMNQNDYTLAQIANIVESNDAKILTMFVASSEFSTQVNVVLKLNRMDIGGILQTFERYDYSIKVSYGEEEEDEILRQRYESLMNYLNI